VGVNDINLSQSQNDPPEGIRSMPVLEERQYSSQDDVLNKSPSKIRLLAQDISRTFSEYGNQQKQMNEMLSKEESERVETAKL
jgi:hypothetical protein